MGPLGEYGLENEKADKYDIKYHTNEQYDSDIPLNRPRYLVSIRAVVSNRTTVFLSDVQEVPTDQMLEERSLSPQVKRS